MKARPDQTVAAAPKKKGRNKGGNCGKGMHGSINQCAPKASLPSAYAGPGPALHVMNVARPPCTRRARSRLTNSAATGEALQNTRTVPRRAPAARAHEAPCILPLPDPPQAHLAQPSRHHPAHPAQPMTVCSITASATTTASPIMPAMYVERDEWLKVTSSGRLAYGRAHHPRIAG